MRKGSAIRRFSIITMMVLAVPAFAAAQHRGGAFASAPAGAGRGAGAVSRAAAPSAQFSARSQSGPQSSARFGTPMVRARNGGRTFHRNNNNNNNANFAFNGTGTDFQDVPGLGFDYPHLAAISGNRHSHNGRFAGGFPFGFGGGFLLGPSILDEAPVIDSQPTDAQSSAVDEQELADDAAPVQRTPRRSRSAHRIESEADNAPPAPLREEEQYVFVRRDGSLVFAVAYTWDSGTLRYITPDGLRRSIGRDALDLDATQQFNEQRGIDFRAPA